MFDSSEFDVWTLYFFFFWSSNAIAAHSSGRLMTLTSLHQIPEIARDSFPPIESWRLRFFFVWNLRSDFLKIIQWLLVLLFTAGFHTRTCSGTWKNHEYVVNKYVIFRDSLRECGTRLVVIFRQIHWRVEVFVSRLFVRVRNTFCNV